MAIEPSLPARRIASAVLRKWSDKHADVRMTFEAWGDLGSAFADVIDRVAYGGEDTEDAEGS